MEDVIEIVKSLEDSGLSLKGVSETIQNEAKEQKGDFLSMLFGTLDAKLLGNLLAGETFMRARYGPKKEMEQLQLVIHLRGPRPKRIFNAALSFE